MHFPSVAKALALLPLVGNVLTGASGGGGSCAKDKKCETGCCSKAGYCGFGPKVCGEDVCISNCDAKAECGRKFGLQRESDTDMSIEYAGVANSTCPLNVCCPEFG